MTKEELMKRTGLSEEDAEILKRTEQMLPMMAELAGADLFIDCMDKTDGIMFVAAQAGPKYMPSAYQKRVVGCAAEQKDEPAVYRALETRTPVRDIKAVTQEDPDRRAGHQQRDPERTEIRGDGETAGGVWFGRVED